MSDPSDDPGPQKVAVIGMFGRFPGAGDVDTLARDGMGRALDCLHQRLHAEDAARTAAIVNGGTPALPTRLYMHHRGNTEFQPTPHANSV